MTSKEKIKKKYPLAYCILGAIHYEPEKYIIRLKSNRVLGGGETKEKAWDDAWAKYGS